MTLIASQKAALCQKLVFGAGNAKLGKGVHTFSLPAGWTCPGALGCLAKADKGSGKVTDGGRGEFRCFAASQEAVYPSVRKSRWGNFDLLRGKSQDAMVTLISDSLPAKAGNSSRARFRGFL